MMKTKAQILLPLSSLLFSSHSLFSPRPKAQGPTQLLKLLKKNVTLMGDQRHNRESLPLCRIGMQWEWQRNWF